ncbi:MAG: hypothetical protein KDA24_06660 [Deltaproteobacteria bacterium]|nr:hypothetical protein [Deltaproteobacteria bacterium]
MNSLAKATPWLLAAVLGMACTSGPTGNLVIGDDDDAMGDDDDAVGDDDDATAVSWAGVWVGEMIILRGNGEELCAGEACLEVDAEGEMNGVAACGGGNQAEYDLTGTLDAAGELNGGEAGTEGFGGGQSYETSGAVDPEEDNTLYIFWEMQFGGGGGGFEVDAKVSAERVSDVDNCDEVRGGFGDAGGGAAGGGAS